MPSWPAIAISTNSLEDGVGECRDADHIVPTIDGDLAGDQDGACVEAILLAGDQDGACVEAILDDFEQIAGLLGGNLP